MATQSKIYKIEIELDQARNALDDATRRLAKMETQLAGLNEIDKKGTFGKAIKEAAIATQAEIDKLTGKVGGLESKLGEVGSAAPGTVGALRQEVIALEAALENSVVGSVEAGAAISQLAEKKSQLRSLSNEIQALNPRAQGRAFTVFGGAVVGAFSVATVAAQTFGLSSEKAQEYQAKLQGLITVLYSLEQVNKALSGENIALGKAILTQGKAWLTAGEAASTGSKVTRAALISSGVGLILLAVAAVLSLVAENWDKLTGSVNGSLGYFGKFKAVVSGLFDGIIEGFKAYYTILYDVLTLDFSGAISTAKNAGKKVGDAYAQGYADSVRESQKAETQKLIEQQERRIKLLQAQGFETEKLERDNLARKVDLQKKDSKAQLDAQNELAVFDATALKKHQAERQAISLQGLTAEAQLRKAKGQETFAEELAIKNQELNQLINAKTRDEAAIGAKEDELAALQVSRVQELTAKEQALLLARLDGLIALRQAKGLETYRQQLGREQAELQILQTAGTRNEAEIRSQLDKIAALKASHAKEQRDQANAAGLAELQAEVSLENARGQDSYEAQRKVEARKLELLKEAGIKNRAAIIDQRAKIKALDVAYERKEEADGRALSIARTQVKIALATAQGQETTALEIELKQKELAALEAQLDRNEAAITVKKGEILAKQYEQERKAADERRALLEEQQGYELALLQKQGKDTLAIEIANARALIALDIDTSEKGLKQKRADIAALNLLLEEQQQRRPSLGNFLLKALGVSDEDLPGVKQRINEAVASLAQSVSSITNAIFSEGLAAADVALQKAQDRLSVLDKQLSDVSKNRESDEKALETASGARRDFLLLKLQKEQAQESKLRAEKAAAAKEQEKALHTRAVLEKEQQQISAASTAIESVLLAIKAAEAVVEASKGGKVGYDNIALAIAAAVAIGASIISVKNASKTLGDGGIIEGGSHASGNDVPVLGGKYRVEGGEGILPVDATQKNRAAFELLRTAGRSRVLTPADFAQIANVRVLPPPTGTFGNGGVLPGGSGLPAGMVAVSQADLSELIGLTRQVVNHTQATASSNETIKSYGPAQLHIGEPEYVRLGEFGQRVDATKAAVSLG